MKVSKLERRDRLHHVCKAIIDGGPRRIDDAARAAFKKAVLQYAATQYLPTNQALKNIYHGDALVADAFDVIAASDTRKQRDDQNFRSTATGALYPKTRRSLFDDVIEDEIDEIDENEENGERDDDDDDDVTKAAARHRVGPHGLAAAVTEQLLDALARRREQHGFTKRQEGPMDQHQELISIMKDHGGPVALCKVIVDRDRSPVGEHELTAAISKAAAAESGEREDVAFAKLFERHEAVRRAVAIAKNVPVIVVSSPSFVAGTVDAFTAVDDDDERSKAYAKLEEMAVAMRGKFPQLSLAQAFERALTAPENAALASAALKHPQATTSYPFPR
jgi:hypothetical protein